MRARLCTLGLIAAFAAPCPRATNAEEPTASETAESAREVRPEAPLARGLVAAPAWALGIAFAGVVLVSVVGLLQLRRSAAR